MKLMTFLRITVSFAIATLASVTTGNASAARTFVSGAGNDANTGTSCGAAAPCRTFAAAYGVTTAGGEIIALDSAGYGSLTITQAISIVGAHPASVTVAANTTGITINAGANLVILRNLQITGAGAANSTGIALTAGKLVLENSSLTRLAVGLNVANSKADVIDTDIIGNTTGVSTTGIGTDPSVFPLVGGPTQVRISLGKVLDNSTAFVMNDPGTGTSGNLITILAFNQGGTINPIVAGNTTFTSGTGPSCANASNCKAILDFSSSKTAQGNIN
jgi:hypothetical protein